MKLLTLILISLSLFACSDKVAGGGSSGSEAGNAITAKIVDGNGTPISGARVRLRAATYFSGDTSNLRFDLKTEKSGNLFLEKIPAGDWRLEVIHQGKALLRSLTLSGTDSTVNLNIDTIHPVSQVQGSIPLPIIPGTHVVIPGTEHSATPDAAGRWVLDSLPAGFHEIRQYAMQIRTDNVGYANPVAGTSVNIGPLSPEHESLLLEDFEDGDTRHRYAEFSGEGWWFLSYDTNSVTINPVLGSFPVPLQTDSERGTVLHFQASFDPASPYSWLDCGVQIGRNYQPYSLVSVDSLVFWAKGSGQAIVTLHFADTVGTPKEPEYFLTLPAVWTRIAIPMDSITVAGTTSASALRTGITSLSWVFIANAELWLDGITLVGVSRQELWP